MYVCVLLCSLCRIKEFTALCGSGDETRGEGDVVMV